MTMVFTQVFISKTEIQVGDGRYLEKTIGELHLDRGLSPQKIVLQKHTVHYSVMRVREALLDGENASITSAHDAQWVGVIYVRP